MLAAAMRQLTHSHSAVPAIGRCHQKTQRIFGFRPSLFAAKPIMACALQCSWSFSAQHAALLYSTQGAQLRMIPAVVLCHVPHDSVPACFRRTAHCDAFVASTA
jgi:hypothetical protein